MHQNLPLTFGTSPKNPLPLRFRFLLLIPLYPLHVPPLPFRGDRLWRKGYVHMGMRYGIDKEVIACGSLRLRIPVHLRFALVRRQRRRGKKDVQPSYPYTRAFFCSPVPTPLYPFRLYLFSCGSLRLH